MNTERLLHMLATNIKAGDIVKYCGSWTDCGVVLKVNHEGGTIKVFRHGTNDVKWWVTSGCEVVSHG